MSEFDQFVEHNINRALDLWEKVFDSGPDNLQEKVLWLIFSYIRAASMATESESFAFWYKDLLFLIQVAITRLELEEANDESL